MKGGNAMLKKQWHTLIIGLIDLIGSFLLIGLIMLEPAFWRDTDGLVIGMMIMGVIALFLLFPIAQGIFGVVCFIVLRKPHEKTMIFYTISQIMSCIITTFAWMAAIGILYEIKTDYSLPAGLVISIFFSSPVNIIKGIITIVFGVKYCKAVTGKTKTP